MENKIDSLIQTISEKIPFQKQYLLDSVAKLSQSEHLQLHHLISFYESQSFTIQAQAKAYLHFFKEALKERRYFNRCRHYRYSKLSEVEANVYSNAEYMTNYMIGLGLSTYLWSETLEIYQWFCKKIHGKTGRNYLEIGPGHGELFVTAAKNTSFQVYTALDISQTSLNTTKSYVAYTEGLQDKRFVYLREDFLQHSLQSQYDTIVMGEVLEHVEHPENFLNQLYQIAAPEAFIYLSTSVNSPAIDHLYQFCSKEQVFDLIEKAQLKILDYICVETAESMDQETINSYDIAMILSVDKII